ncbi:odorant receptor Or2 [Monomorium pharaonis]|uniref:odorant receptor Or2 n=1 Tax=Monomorium pharaonis TaxID=307658 RepID=UPI00063F24E8|nr:odorant receptor Or2 [Monomorium pharaonis]
MHDIDQFFQDSDYNILRVLLGAVGLWPFHTRNRRYTIYIVIMLLLGSALLFQLLDIIAIRNDFFAVINTIPFILHFIIVINKAICSIYKLPQIKILLIMMYEYRISPKSDEETKLQNLHSQYGRKLSYTYMGCLIGFYALYYLIDTLSVRTIRTKYNETEELSNKTLHYQISGISSSINSTLVDEDTESLPIFIHFFMCDCVAIILIIVSDVLYVTVTEYCCGLFAALRYRLEFALIFDNNELTITEDKSYSNIVYSIRRHIESIQFVTNMESVLSLNLFVQTGSFVLIIALLVYEVTNIGIFMGRSYIVKAVAYLNFVLINVFFENWLGQKIIDSSEKVFESVYNAEWYSMPIITRKLLIMLMMKTEKPLMLKMGKLFELSFATFNTILRTSSSYFMLLQSL